MGVRAGGDGGTGWMAAASGDLLLLLLLPVPVLHCRYCFRRRCPVRLLPLLRWPPQLLRPLPLLPTPCWRSNRCHTRSRRPR
uniref:Putative secreted protein n=1 Tax=Anopheles darlingi TaxID=43151 RepID=A0A2M4DRG6_ANODA